MGGLCPLLPKENRWQIPFCPQGSSQQEDWKVKRGHAVAAICSEQAVQGMGCCWGCSSQVCCHSRLCPALFWKLLWAAASTVTVAAVITRHRQPGLQPGPCEPCNSQCCSGMAHLHGAAQVCLEMWFPQPHGTNQGYPGSGLWSGLGASCRSCSG